MSETGIARIPIESLRGHYTANKRGDVDWMVRAFAPGDRQKIRETFAKPERLERNTIQFQQMYEARIEQVVFYGEYVFLIGAYIFSNGQRFPIEYAMKNTEEGWLATNELIWDPVYRFVLNAVQPVQFRPPRQ